MEPRLLLSTYKTSPIANFGVYPNGDNAGSAPIIDSNGDLFGISRGGGPLNEGTVFEIANGSSTITTFATFSGTNGLDPNSTSLILDHSGNLFGTTYSGDNSDGTAFEIPKGSNTITTLATFTGTNGAYPEGQITFDSSGNLFGTTYKGGANNDGTVFEIGNGSNAITTLASLLPMDFILRVA